MGNVASSSRGAGGGASGNGGQKSDPISANIDSSPLAFHNVHGENIRISVDGRSATRVESFCKGLAFSHRPVAPMERVYLSFVQVSTSWSGVLRLGFTGIDPAFLNPASLPRYACPDLTNKPLNWAKALAEQYAEYMYSLYFYYTKSGDVYYGVNNEDKGLFFSGVNPNCSLWVMLDIYGNTKTVEFVDPPRVDNGNFLLNNQLSVMNNGQSQFSVDGSGQSHNGRLNNRNFYSNISQQGQIPSGGVNNRLSAPNLNAGAGDPFATRDIGFGGGGGGPLNAAHINALPRSNSLDTPSTPSNNHIDSPRSSHFPNHHPPHLLSPLHFHGTHGQNVRLSDENDVAFRIEEEYCNAYVFTSRPLRPGEAVVIQIQKVELMYLGTLAFGLTSCDPGHITMQELPDDSDDLLDRKEYWVVNKDVGGVPGEGDELSFLLTPDGQIIYSKNCRQLAVLMHVDVSMPLWVFFDVYGNTSKIKMLGCLPGADASALNPSASSSRPTSLPTALPLPSSSPPASPPTFSAAPDTANNHNQRAYSGGASSPQLVVSLPPLTNSFPENGVSFPPLPHHSTSSAAVDAAGPLPSGGAAAGPSNSLGSPMSLTEDEMQHERNAFAENVSLGLYQPTPIPASSSSAAAAGITGNKKSSSHKGAAAGKRANDDAATASADNGDEAGNEVGAECTVCYERAVDSVLYTCGHCCMCYDCAWECKQTRGGLCPICRAPIRDVIRIYRS